MSTIGIVILNYNNCKDTIACVESIESFNTEPVKYIVVDNGSTEENGVSNLSAYFKDRFGDNSLFISESKKQIDRLPRLSFIASPHNDGYARGNNKGLFYAFQDSEIQYVLILNNDIVFQSDLLPVLRKSYESLPTPGIITPLLRNRKKTEFNCARRCPDNWQVIRPFLFFNRNFFNKLSKDSISLKYLRTNPELMERTAFEIDLPSGSFMFISKELFSSVNGFDPGTFLYYEENILCKKFKEKGVINYCIPTVSAFHFGGASTNKTSPVFLQKCSIQSANYYLRNFTDLTFLQRIIWGLTQAAWALNFKIKRDAK